MKHSGGVRDFLRQNKFPLLIAAAWLVIVWSLVLAADVFFKKPLGLDAWAGDWDAGWYRSIAEGGYAQGPINQQVNVAFFPLLPSLTWLVGKVTLLPTVWAGMLISSVSFAAALIVLWHLVGKLFTRQIARWTLLLVAFNPFSLYFGMFYTESLFLLLAASAFWFIYEKQWWLAAFFAGLATATRSVGVAVAASVLAGWLFSRAPKKVRAQAAGWRGVALHSPHSKTKQQKKQHGPWLRWSVKTVALTALAFSGLVAFSWYLWQHTGDPFAYRTAQQFWPGRGGLTNIGNELVYLWEHKLVNLEYLITLMWYVSTILALIGLALVLRMKQWLLALYTAIALALPLIFGTAAAMNRYMLVAFPIFIAYAAVLTKVPAWLRIALLVVGIAGLSVITFLMVDPRHPSIA